VRASDGGVAVDFARPHEAAEAIANGLRSQSGRTLMGGRGAAYAERSFSWERVLEIYERTARAARADRSAAAIAAV
jgi:glycosyltransferase involved in cell wall biosynthesis